MAAMATPTAPNLSSLSSCSPSSPSFSLPKFASPKKTFQISCLNPKRSSFLNPIKCNDMGYGFFTENISMAANSHVAPTKKPGQVARDFMVAKATEVVASTSEEEASPESKSKSSKKGKDGKYPRRILDIYQILQNPIITESAIKNIAEENSLLFTVDVRADKKMIKEAITNFFGVKVRKVNTSIRPDGTKKAFVMLSREYNASDVAKSIGIFPSSG